MLLSKNSSFIKARGRFFTNIISQGRKSVSERKYLLTWENLALTSHVVNSGRLKNLDAIVLNVVMVITLFLVNYLSCLLNVYNIVI